MKKIKSLLFAATVLVGAGVFATSCGGNGTDDTLSVTPGTLSFSSVDTKEEMVIVKTNVTDWNQVPSADWVVTEKSGKSLKVTVKDNTAKEARTATITFSAGSASNVTVTVNQAGTGSIVEKPTFEQLLGEYTFEGIGAYLKENFDKEVKFTSTFTQRKDINENAIAGELNASNFANNKVLNYVFTYAGDGMIVFPTTETGVITEDKKYYGVQVTFIIKDNIITHLPNLKVETKWKAVSNTIELPTKTTVDGKEYELSYVIAAVLKADNSFTTSIFGDGFRNIVLSKSVPIKSAASGANFTPSFGEYGSMVKKQTVSKISTISDLVVTDLKFNK